MATPNVSKKITKKSMKTPPVGSLKKKKLNGDSKKSNAKAITKEINKVLAKKAAKETFKKKFTKETKKKPSAKKTKKAASVSSSDEGEDDENDDDAAAPDDVSVDEEPASKKETTKSPAEQLADAASKRRRLNAAARQRGFRKHATAAGLTAKDQLKACFSLAAVSRMLHYRPMVVDNNTLPYDFDEVKLRWDIASAKVPPTSVAALQPFIEGAARSLCNAATVNAFNSGRTTVQPSNLIAAARGALGALEFSTVAPHGLISYAQRHDKYGRSLNDVEDDPENCVTAAEMMLAATEEDKAPLEDEDLELEDGSTMTKLEAYKDLIQSYEEQMAAKPKKAKAIEKKAGKKAGKK